MLSKLNHRRIRNREANSNREKNKRDNPSNPFDVQILSSPQTTATSPKDDGDNSIPIAKNYYNNDNLSPENNGSSNNNNSNSKAHFLEKWKRKRPSASKSKLLPDQQQIDNYEKPNSSYKDDPANSSDTTTMESTNNSDPKPIPPENLSISYPSPSTSTSNRNSLKIDEATPRISSEKTAPPSPIPSPSSLSPSWHSRKHRPRSATTHRPTTTKSSASSPGSSPDSIINSPERKRLTFRRSLRANTISHSSNDRDEEITISQRWNVYSLIEKLVSSNKYVTMDEIQGKLNHYSKRFLGNPQAIETKPFCDMEHDLQISSIRRGVPIKVTPSEPSTPTSGHAASDATSTSHSTSTSANASSSTTSTTTTKGKNILVGLDGSQQSFKALELALDLMNMEVDQLLVVTVYDNSEPHFSRNYKCNNNNCCYNNNNNNNHSHHHNSSSNNNNNNDINTGTDSYCCTSNNHNPVVQVFGQHYENLLIRHLRWTAAWSILNKCEKQLLPSKVNYILLVEGGSHPGEVLVRTAKKWRVDTIFIGLKRGVRQKVNLHEYLRTHQIEDKRVNYNSIVLAN